MADETSTSLDRTDLSNRIGELTQRWLPMMLWRVGVPNSQTERLRVAVEDDQGLRDRLDFARGAVMFASTERAGPGSPAALLAESVIEIVSQLRLALDQGDQDLEGAQRRVDGVNRQLIRLIVVGAPASPEVVQVQTDLGPSKSAPFTHASWWTRLLSRGDSVVGWTHN